MSFWTSRLVRARKRYHCIGCGELIDVGDLYNREQGIWEDEFQNQTWHPECLAAWLEEKDSYGEIFSGEHERPFVHQGANI